MSTWYYRFEPDDASTLSDLRARLISIVEHEPDDEQGSSVRFEIRGPLFHEKIEPELERIGFTGRVEEDGETQGYNIQYWTYEDGQRTEEEEIEDPYYACRDYTFTPNDPSDLKKLLDSFASIVPYAFLEVEDGAISAAGIQGGRFDNIEWGRGEVSKELERLKFSGFVTVHEEGHHEVGPKEEPIMHWVYRSGKKIAEESGPFEWDLVKHGTKKKPRRRKATTKKTAKKKATRKKAPKKKPTKKKATKKKTSRKKATQKKASKKKVAKKKTTKKKTSKKKATTKKSTKKKARRKKR